MLAVLVSVAFLLLSLCLVVLQEINSNETFHSQERSISNFSSYY